MRLGMRFPYLFLGASVFAVLGLSACGRKPAAVRQPAPAAASPSAPAKLSATPALDPKGTIDWAKQNLDAAQAKEQAGAQGL